MPFYIDVLLYMTTVFIYWNTVFFCAVHADRYIPFPLTLLTYTCHSATL